MWCSLLSYLLTGVLNMQRIKWTSAPAAAALAIYAASSAGLASAANSAAVADATIVSGTWQHHTVTFPYYGRTSKYNCSGLEGTVRAILLHLGARNDLTVTTGGCGAANTPGQSAFVATDFYSLAPSADSGASGSVAAHWTAKQLNKDHPYFMDYGACELIQQMKDLITQSFAMRDLQYRTDCLPNEFSLSAFSVKGKALTAVSTAKN
jgi:hypothetical protein